MCVEPLVQAFEDDCISAFRSSDRGAHERAMLTSIRICSGPINLVEAKFLNREIVLLVESGDCFPCKIASSWQMHPIVRVVLAAVGPVSRGHSVRGLLSPDSVKFEVQERLRSVRQHHTFSNVESV